MIRVLTSLFLGMGLLVMVASYSVPVANAAPEPKLEVCHLPPGNSGNFHTITIKLSALPAHLAHGDIQESCSEFLCDDGDLCTVDAFEDGTEICKVDVPVNCDDSDLNTRDSCDSAAGCINEPIVEVPEPEVTAQSQSVTLTDGNPVTITLVGNSLDIEPGESLSFITTQGANGVVSSPPNPVIPPQVQLCSVDRSPCTQDSDCPDYLNGEICALTTPASTSATVTYDPTGTAVDDSFDFTVTFGSASDTATVTIFGPGDEGSTTPPEISNIEAVDQSAQVSVGGAQDIVIRGDAPGTVGDLSFAIITSPSEGTLTTPAPNPRTDGNCSVSTGLLCQIDANCDPGVPFGTCSLEPSQICDPAVLTCSGNAGQCIAAPPGQTCVIPGIRTATVTYTHTGTGTGADSFEFQVCEVASPASCSTTNGTVIIAISDPGELAPDRAYEGNIRQPIEFKLGL